jgi:uncharacterized membrane protein YfcA
MENMLLLAEIGCIAGFFSGLLGIGGGIFVVPALMLVLPQLGLAGPDLVKIAMATSLTTTVMTSIAGVRQHIASRAVDWIALRRLTPGIMLGSFAGSQLSAAVNGELLTILFIGFLLYGAWSMARGRRAAHRPAAPLPGLPALSVKGFGIGIFCSMLGMGGASFTVPLLAACLSVQRSIGTAAALGIPLAVTAAAGYLLAPTPVATCSIGCTGFVYLTGVGAIATTTILTAPLGAYLTHIMPAKPLRRVFAVTMAVIAIHTAWKTLPSAGYAVTRDAQAAGVPGWLRH